MRNYWLKVLALACVGLAIALPQPGYSIGEEVYKKEDIITRDVCIVGGGPSATYAATRSRQLGQSVMVIEQAPLMGVIFFHNTSIVRNYFEYYETLLANIGFVPGGTNYNVTSTTGEIIAGSPPNETLALATLADYVVQLEKYPYLVTGFDLPIPVPEDLLIPIKDFVKKYNFGPMVPFSQLGGKGGRGGFADIIQQPTLYTMNLLGPDLVRSITAGFISTAAHDNGALYEAATAKFTAASSLLLSSTIISVSRNNDGNGTAVIVVQTPTGNKLIKARKIVVAVRPHLGNFPGKDLDAIEKDVFGTYTNEGYWTGILSGTGPPDGASINRVGAHMSDNLPIFPGVTAFTPIAESGRFIAEYTSPYVMNDEFVKTNITAALGRLKIPGITRTSNEAEWKVFILHTRFFDERADQRWIL